MFVKKILPLFLLCALLAGCAQTAAEGMAEVPVETSAETQEEAYTAQTELVEIELEDEAVALAASPAAQSTLLLPVASGTAVQKTDKAVIDYSNSKDGYVMAQYTAATSQRLKVQVKGPTTTYTYDLPAGSWATFPLSDGNGSYKVDVLENTTGKKYAYVVSASFQVTLSDECARCMRPSQGVAYGGTATTPARAGGPFLRPNQYVDYGVAPNTVAKAQELAGSIADPLQKVAKIYDYVVASLTYDKEKAAAVQSGYLPVLDTVLSTKKGICFDYASLMAGMLRSQGVPCKLVVGYAGTAYHAWINVWTKETGWVDGVIFFDGTTWQRMDPTFASSGKGSDSIMQYIGDGSNYTAKYLY